MNPENIFLKSVWAHRFAALLLGTFLVQGTLLIGATSPTADEVAFHTVNGYAYLKTGNYRMSPANPALIREWMALPWLAMRLNLDLNSQSWRDADSVPFAKKFMYQDNQSVAETLLFLSRFMILLLGALLGWVVYRWAVDLYGKQGGLLSLFFYVTCPSVLAHASLATTDIGVSLFCVSTLFFLDRWMRNKKTSDWIGAGIFFGLACAAKYNALYLTPILFFFIWRSAGKGKMFRSILFFGVSVLAILWASYQFEFKPLLWEAVPRIDEKLRDIHKIAMVFGGGSQSFAAWAQNAAQNIPIPAPSYWLGLGGIVMGHQEAYRHYMFGEWTTQAVWYYYLFSFVVKMTIPFLLVLGVRWFDFWRQPKRSQNSEALILSAVGLLFVITFFDSTAVGIRYLLPVIPLLYIWVGRLALWNIKKRIVWFLGTLLVVAQLGSTLPYFPNFISYFNHFIGGPEQGFRYVRGSDVDWGQGLKALKKYLEKTGNPQVKLSYFGGGDASFYGIDHEPITSAERLMPEQHLYAISVFKLEGVPWTKSRIPDRVIANSIFIYDFRDSVRGAR